MQTIEKLNDAGAVKALAEVTRKWGQHRGVEALVVLTQARQRQKAAFEASPAWAIDTPEATAEAGSFARKMLVSLATGNDDEVISWTETAIKAQAEATAHVLDPITLSILGGIIIGGILAARVKKIGPVEFYEGIPKELGDVMKAGAAIAVPKTF
jgi:hypothetical protein